MAKTAESESLCRYGAERKRLQSWKSRGAKALAEKIDTRRRSSAEKKLQLSAWRNLATLLHICKIQKRKIAAIKRLMALINAQKLRQPGSLAAKMAVTISALGCRREEAKCERKYLASKRSAKMQSADSWLNQNEEKPEKHAMKPEKWRKMRNEKRSKRKIAVRNAKRNDMKWSNSNRRKQKRNMAHRRQWKKKQLAVLACYQCGNRKLGEETWKLLDNEAERNLACSFGRSTWQSCEMQYRPGWRRGWLSVSAERRK